MGLIRATCDGATIEVLKWSEYNPRTDSKKPSWFRVENSMATDATFFDLDCEQKWLWIVILSLVSQKNGQTIVWNSSFIHNLTRISKKKQDDTIDIFEKFARLRVTRKVTSRDSPATNERTNERTNSIDRFDFEAIYKRYPRKQGKQDGLRKCKAQIKTKADYDALANALEKYIKHLRTQNTQPEYIKHFSTFMSSWRDWCDVDAGKIILVTTQRPEHVVVRPPENIERIAPARTAELAKIARLAAARGQEKEPPE